MVRTCRAGVHHCDLRLCIILRLTSLAPAPDKEISVNCDQQTKEDKCVSHILSSNSASFALAEEKKLTGQSSRACFVSDAS